MCIRLILSLLARRLLRRVRGSAPPKLNVILHVLYLFCLIKAPIYTASKVVDVARSAAGSCSLKGEIDAGHGGKGRASERETEL